MKASHSIWIVGVLAAVLSDQCRADLNGCDDFNDNSKDPARWGTDFTNGVGLLTETNGRLEYTTSGVSTGSHGAARPWILNFGSYTENWAVQIDVSVPQLALSELFVGLLICPGTNLDLNNVFRLDLATPRLDVRSFGANVHVNGDKSAVGQQPTASTFGAVRIAFDANTKVFSAFYDEDGPSGGYSWLLLGSTNVPAAWNMTSASAFGVWVFVSSDFPSVSSTNNVFGDNFCASSGARNVFPIVTTNADTTASLASDGTNYLIGLQGDYAPGLGYYITAQMFGPTGALIGSRINPVPGHTGGNPQLACSGTNYLMVWPDDYGKTGETGNSSINGQLINLSGALAGGTIAITTNYQQKFRQLESVAYGAGRYLVAWSDHSNGTNWAVHGQLVSSAGALVGGNFVISAPVDGQDEKGASVAFDGTNFLVVWQLNSTSGGDHNVTTGVFVSPSGAMGTNFPIAQTVSPNGNPLYLVFNGTNYLVVWNYDSGLGGTNPPVWNLHGRFVTPSRTPQGNEFAIVTNGNPVFPSLAFDGANYLLCWSQGSIFSPTNVSVQFQFLNSSGQPTGPQFTPFAAQGNEVPLLATLLYDGKRFVSVATLSANGWLATNDVGIYGTFIPASTAPPQLAVAAPFTNKQFSLSLAGTPGISYAIQGITTLGLTNWMALVTNSPTNNRSFSFTDTSATNSSRFYRAVKQ